MSDLARIYPLPGVDTAPGDRPATFAEYLVSIGLSAGTVRNYGWRLNLAERIIAGMGATLLTADAFQMAALSEATSNTHSLRGQLRCTLKHYFEWQDRNDAPLRAIRVPPQPQMVNKALEVEDAKRLVETARGWWPEGAAVLFGMYLALRREEIAKAEWSRFDEDMEWYTVTGKNSKTATLPVHPALAAELAPRRGEGYIFPGRFGGHMCMATIWTWSKKVARAAGIETFTTHQLRHTSLTTALDNTGPLRSVMEFARHTKPETTAGYTRTTKAQQKTAAARLIERGRL
ncbi:MAG: tyrosine-type recombinase/integrase, partial [Acidobacteria bacterium]|nr:tyrosine-type recombinase/integrase [Acidobacteriota bacterium]